MVIIPSLTHSLQNCSKLSVDSKLLLGGELENFNIELYETARVLENFINIYLDFTDMQMYDVDVDLTTASKLRTL